MCFLVYKCWCTMNYSAPSPSTVWPVSASEFTTKETSLACKHWFPFFFFFFWTVALWYVHEILLSSTTLNLKYRTFSINSCLCYYAWLSVKCDFSVVYCQVCTHIGYSVSQCRCFLVYKCWCTMNEYILFKLKYIWLHNIWVKEQKQINEHIWLI